MKKFLSLSILLFNFLMFNYSYAQKDASNLRGDLPKMLGANNVGKEFWFSIPPCYEDESDGKSQFVKIYVTSNTETPVTVEIPKSNFVLTKNSIANDVIEFLVTPAIAQAWTKSGHENAPKEAVITGAGIHVYADQPIVVYVMIRYLYTSDGFLAIPVSSLGYEYVSACYEDMSAMYPGFSLPGELTITSPFDNTKVYVKIGGNPKTMTTGGKISGDSYFITMQEGDVYTLATKDANGDLSGTLIQSTKPVAVVSGNQCANIPVNNRWCDYIVEADIPTHTWGKTYHVPQIPNRKYPSIIRVFSKDTNTTIYRDGAEIGLIPNGPGGTFNRAFVEMRLSPVDEIKSRVISGDKPINVVLYNTGVEEDGQNIANSDPFMMSIAPFEQYQKEITFCTPGLNGNGFIENYVAVVFQLDDTESIPEGLKFAEVKAGQYSWTSVKNRFNSNFERFSGNVNGEYYGLKILTLPSDGTYKIKDDNKLTCYSFGFSSYDSYGYPTSSALLDVVKNDTLPPAITYSMHKNGFIEDATVVDMPIDPNKRTNLSMIVFIKDSSYNYNFSYKKFEPGAASTTWKLEPIDPNKKARAVVTFCDRNGNDSTIVIEYKPTISSVEVELSTFIYPNPAKDYIFVCHSALDAESISLTGLGGRLTDSPSNKSGQVGVFYEIYNIFGEKVEQTFLSVQTGQTGMSDRQKIDISNLPTGVYFIKIGNQFEKFVKI